MKSNSNTSATSTNATANAAAGAFDTQKYNIVVIANVTKNGFYRVAVYNKTSKAAADEYTFHSANSAWRYAWVLRFRWGVPISQKSFNLLRSLKEKELREAAEALNASATPSPEAAPAAAPTPEPAPKPARSRRKKA